MEEINVGPFEEIAKTCENICSISEDVDGRLYVATLEGFIYASSGQDFEKIMETGGQPCSLITDNSDTIFITDMAQQAIYSYSDQDSAMQELIKNFDEKPFIGPNSLVFHEMTNSLYFTDSGPMGDTSLINPRGSAYVADVEQGTIRPIILNCLAHPSGIAITQDGKIVYIAETYKNRILRVSVSNNETFLTSVFYQFSGRLGPTALCVSENNHLYAAHFDFQTASSKGKIYILNSSGVCIKCFSTPISEINSLSFSKLKPNVLYITGCGKAFKATIPAI